MPQTARAEYQANVRHGGPFTYYLTSYLPSTDKHHCGSIRPEIIRGVVMDHEEGLKR
jgi:hypothetical protein